MTEDRPLYADGTWRPERALNERWLCVRLRYLLGTLYAPDNVARAVYEQRGEPFYFDSQAEAQRQCDALNG